MVLSSPPPVALALHIFFFVFHLLTFHTHCSPVDVPMVIAPSPRYPSSAPPLIAHHKCFLYQKFILSPITHHSHCHTRNIPNNISSLLYSILQWFPCALYVCMRVGGCPSRASTFNMRFPLTKHFRNCSCGACISVSQLI